MPTARVKFDNFGELSGRDTLELLGPTLPVQIGYDRAFQPGDLGAPKLPEAYWPALVDSGAFECCIDSSLAMQLGLPIVEKDTIVGVYGSLEVPFHLAQIYIPELSWTIYGKFASVHLASTGQHHMALLGRNFLQRFTMIYEGRSGVVTISND